MQKITDYKLQLNLHAALLGHALQKYFAFTIPDTQFSCWLTWRQSFQLLSNSEEIPAGEKLQQGIQSSRAWIWDVSWGCK